jgi:hypothetical protein
VSIFNIVEAISDEEQVYDQPCAHENRVGGHSTYCHNEAMGMRKCYYRYTSLERHRKCEGFKDNPAYNGQWEEK